VPGLGLQAGEAIERSRIGWVQRDLFLGVPARIHVRDSRCEHGLAPPLFQCADTSPDRSQGDDARNAEESRLLRTHSSCLSFISMGHDE